MMIFQTGNKQIERVNFENGSAELRHSSCRRFQRYCAFTLIELMLVMAMLTVVLSVSWPSLSRFFRSRNTDSEARRFLALTRYAQSRAVSEGIPMLLWIDPAQQTYGLHADSSYTNSDDRLLEYKTGNEIVLQVQQPPLLQRKNNQSAAKRRALNTGNLFQIEFTPDGFISETSPEYIFVLLRTPDEQVNRDSAQQLITIGLSRNRLHYEIKTNNEAYLPENP